jgi:23S rRNA (adenine2503-C2)-methyltransferase
VYSFLQDRDLPAYRGNQLIQWIYKKYASQIDDITEFSKDLRGRLNEISYISNLVLKKRLKASDSTEKYLFELEDGQRIESVLIPAEQRMTLCISSQVGCSMGCRFCLTSRGGLVRNLKSYEIIDQILSVDKIISPKRVTNIVFMGMGEPLSNFDEVVKALWNIVECMGISRRRITVSTAGIVPKIFLFAKKAPDVNLAVSLNATNDEQRNRLMPINKKYPLKSILAACKQYPLKPGRKITFEYIMIAGENDSIEDARRLSQLLTRIPCKVNIIPINTFPKSSLKKPPDENILAFQTFLLDNRIRAFIRESRGQEIFAACGQLRADSESKNILT